MARVTFIYFDRGTSFQLYNCEKFFLDTINDRISKLLLNNKNIYEAEISFSHAPNIKKQIVKINFNIHFLNGVKKYGQINTCFGKGSLVFTNGMIEVFIKEIKAIITPTTSYHY